MGQVARTTHTATLPIFAEMQRERPLALVGTRGFSYRDWKGDYYPQSLPSRSWLGYYAARFDTVEINLTFYRPPSASTLLARKDAVPPDFDFTLKASKLITHEKRLHDCGDDVERMVKDYSPLESKLGCILFQLPPSLRFSSGLLEEFLDVVTRKLHEALIRLRLAVEFRHSSWSRVDVLELLASRGWAMVIHDMRRAGEWRVSEAGLDSGATSLSYEELLSASARWLCLRLHGANVRYAGEYFDAGLQSWARLARSALNRGFHIRACFNNTTAGAAARDALRFARLIRAEASYSE
jgi:uncharacterized protein YecE (DUF72 family)